jgi:hypothetical protein
VAPHAIQADIDKLTRDATQIVLILHRERGQSLEYEQHAPQELQAPIGRHVLDFCCAILSTQKLGGAVPMDQVAALLLSYTSERA